MQLTQAEKNSLWLGGELSWKLHSAQRKIYDDLGDSSEILIFCARQFGKSYLSVILALEHCLRNPGSIVRIAGPTLKQVKDIVSDNLAPICLDAPQGLIKRHKSEYRWTVGKSSLRLGILERANSDSLRGGNAGLVICEEGCFVPSDDYSYAISSIIGPQLLRSRGRLIHVTTPSKREPEHVIHQDIKDRCELANNFYRYTVYDNPQLGPEHIAQAMRLAGGSESDDWKSEYLCEIIRVQDSVCVPEFDESLHVRGHGNRPTISLNLLVSTDVGGVRDKTVSLLIGHNPLNGISYVLEEAVFATNTASAAIIEGIRQFGFAPRHYADAPGQLLIDWEQQHQYSATLPLKDDWRAGLNNVRIMLQTGKLLINPNCAFLIKTLKGATFNRDRTDFGRSNLLGHMDALAALSYGCRMIDLYTLPTQKRTAYGDRYLAISNSDGPDSENTELARLFK